MAAHIEPDPVDFFLKPPQSRPEQSRGKWGLQSPSAHAMLIILRAPLAYTDLEWSESVEETE